MGARQPKTSQIIVSLMRKSNVFMWSALVWLLNLATNHAAEQQWRLDSSRPTTLGHGVVLVVKNLGGPTRVEMKLVVFNEQQCQLKVIANKDRKTARSLDETGRTLQALAVCNGGYFVAGGDFGPSGLEIADGRRTGEFVGGGGWVGALMVRQAKASLIVESEFRDSPDIDEFVQCSPWLINGGAIAPVLLKGQDQRNRRTFIMTDGRGRWAMGVCGGVGLLELARILQAPGIISELKVQRALNLDGGPSTGLWCREVDGREHFQKPGWAVRNVIAVIPRESK